VAEWLILRVQFFLTKNLSMTQQEVLNALSQVQEPDLGKDLVTLNMIRDLAIEGKRVSLPLCSPRRPAQ